MHGTCITFSSASSAASRRTASRTTKTLGAIYMEMLLTDKNANMDTAKKQTENDRTTRLQYVSRLCAETRYLICEHSLWSALPFWQGGLHDVQADEGFILVALASFHNPLRFQ